MDRNYRIHTNVSSDTVLNVNMKQDFDFLEVLSLKLRQEDAYRLHSSNYGVIIGRVLANDAFGIPNAKVSVFIERDDSDSIEMEALYPYTEVTSKDEDGRRYNLLPDYSDDDCYRVVGTFPNKRLVLDDNTHMEVFDKYWKYTTVTNQAGDYMIFGVPTGSQQLHVDIDLSDIGVLSQKPRDFEYKGYNLSMFDNPNQFKESTNLDGLAQLFSQNQSVFVYPFWGDADNGVAAITRSDIQIQYKFEPTCVFMGSIVSDNDGHSIGHKCSPDEDSGLNNQLIAGNGTIEMIRKTTDGLVEEYQIQGNQLIDEDGVWCYQIPMNLDYIGTDEYGNLVPTDNPNKGIPTRTQVRFRISKTETDDEGFSRHTAKYLVPQNPIFSEDRVVPTVAMNGAEVEKMYNFGSATPEWCFRDLYWNNVYSVKNFIPRIQVASRAASHNYTGLKGANLADDQNPIPFNKLRIDMPFMFMIVCILFTIVMYIVCIINSVIICSVNYILAALEWAASVICVGIPYVMTFCPFKWLLKQLGIGVLDCLRLEAGLTEGDVVYFPCCYCHSLNDYGSCGDVDNCRKSDDNQDLLDKVQRNLALEHKIVKLDLYQDWINGVLYLPLWHWRKRKKKTFLFGLFSSRAKSEYCSCDKNYSKLRTTVTCNIRYESNSLGTSSSNMPSSEKRWQSYRSDTVRFRRGVIKPVENQDGLTAYYYTALQATSDAANPSMEMAERSANFPAIRLFATDIILLGSLVENNLYGIPQFFTCLPSTTSNVPPIATVEETNEEEKDEQEGASSDFVETVSDCGTTVTTGMDWGHNGDESKPQYKKGLFMDLGCTVAYTRAKSCINVERLSELGMNLDTSLSTQFSDGTQLRDGTYEADGFITKLELDDNDNRAMFATLNHIGFIPQSYQDSISAYQTQVNDPNTNYLVNKFKYIYPVDFDGRLATPIRQYKRNFKQAMFDDVDESYLTFRLGAENGDRDENSEGRIRHFYHNSGNRFSMPLYNNSFYFYFGVNKGSTAIDKFNKMFYAQCTKNTKLPFTMDIDMRGASYCIDAYNEGAKNEAYGYIRVNVDDVRVPYSYALYDSNRRLVIRESGMTQPYFIIQGEADSVTGDVTAHSAITYQMDGTTLMNGNEPVSLSNQTYVLEITDADGKTLTEQVNLEKSKIDGDYLVTRLGARYYDSGDTKLDYICNAENQLYGMLTLNGFSVDGYNCALGASSIINVAQDEVTGTLSFCLSGSSEVSDHVYALLEVRATSMDAGSATTDCLCDSENAMAEELGGDLAADSMVNSGTPYAMVAVYDDSGQNIVGYKLEIYVYQPTTFLCTLTQSCPNSGSTSPCSNLVNANSSSEMLTVQNGNNFNTFLNNMPLKFMLGTTTDNVQASVANRSFFYKTEAVTDASDANISGWYGLHEEASYRFTPTYSANQAVWEDFVDFSEEITQPSTKKMILKFKFDSMFELSNAAYIIADANNSFMLSAEGGVAPTLIRNISPMYQGEDMSTFLFTDSSTVNAVYTAPNIVSSNCSGHTQDEPGLPSFNKAFSARNNSEEYVGNYFAAFTNDGGYISKKAISSGESVMRAPSFASVSPYNSTTPKEKGKDIEGRINTNFRLAHTSSSQTLTGDKTRQVNPWLRAMFVDRRLDYNLTILAPIIGSSSFRLHEDNPNAEAVWQGARISGQTYNGVEMSYDQDYNIISADVVTEEETLEYVSASANNRLEYSFAYGTGSTNAVTQYNKGDANSIWITDIGDATHDTGGHQVVKRFYEATLGGADIRNFLWSDFNKNRLSQYIRNEQTSGYTALVDSATTPYVFAYPSEMGDMYNGDFNRESVIAGNGYPTKRFIDVGKLPSSQTYSLTISNCSYNMSSTNNNDGTMTCEVKGDEAIDISLNYERPIQVLAPNTDDKNYANVVYEFDNRLDLFDADKLSMSFSYTEASCNDFEVYTKKPKFITVIPFTNGTDGISYYKMANMGNEFTAANGGSTFSNGKTLDEAIDDIGMPNARIKTSRPSGVKEKNGLKLKNGQTVEGTFYQKNGEPLSSVDDDFLNITYSVKNINLDTTQVFAILVDREYYSTTEDGLSKRIRSVECSELFDARHLVMHVAPEDYSASTVPQYNYAYKTSVDESGNTQYGQVLTFCIDYLAHSSEYPSSRSGETMNQVFKNPDRLTFTIRFSGENESYYIDDVSATTITDGAGDDEENVKAVYLSVTWTPEMGMLCQKRWKPRSLGPLGTIGGCNCSILARTSSDFTYRIDFSISTSQDEEDVEQALETQERVFTPVIRSPKL